MLCHFLQSIDLSKDKVHILQVLSAAMQKYHTSVSDKINDKINRIFVQLIVHYKSNQLDRAIQGQIYHTFDEIIYELLHPNPSISIDEGSSIDSCMRQAMLLIENRQGLMSLICKKNRPLLEQVSQSIIHYVQ